MPFRQKCLKVDSLLLGFIPSFFARGAMKQGIAILLLLCTLATLAVPVAADAGYSTKIPVPAKPAGFDIYKEPINTPQHLDWLWQDYLQHGKKKAIARIVDALELGSYAGSLQKAQAVQKTRALTEEEQQNAFLEAVFEAAMWSLTSNAKQHPEVLEELKRIEQRNRPHAKPVAHGYLLLLLTRVAPDDYTFVPQKNRLTVTTPTGDVHFNVKK